MTKSFWALQPGNIGFKVKYKGKMETDWIVAALLTKEKAVRVYRFDRNGNTLALVISKDEYETWQKS